MRHRIFCALVIFIASAVVARAETRKPEYPFTVDKSIGTAVFSAKTFDEVWGATIKTLVKAHYRLGVVEKDAGIIEAVYAPADSKFWGKKSGKGTEMSALVESGENGISVILTWHRGEKIVIRGMQAQLKKVYGEFFQGVADILYPPEGAA